MPLVVAHSALMLVAGPSEPKRHYSTFGSPVPVLGGFAAFLTKWTVF